MSNNYTLGMRAMLLIWKLRSSMSTPPEIMVMSHLMRATLLIRKLPTSVSTLLEMMVMSHLMSDVLH